MKDKAHIRLVDAHAECDCRCEHQIIFGDEPVVRGLALFAVEAGGTPTRNGKPISASSRSELNDAVVTIGFSKSKEAMDAGMARYRKIAYQVRKTRMMGSAALALAYIACGRLDAYIEEQISLWDIAAGQLLVEAAGGSIKLSDSTSHPDKWGIVAHNGKLPLEEL